MRLYACKFYENGVLVRNYVPSQNPDNVIGLYDCVTKTFYSNAGTGVFTGG